MDGRRSHPTSSSRAPERRPTGDRRDWHGSRASAATTDDRIPDADGDIARGRVRFAPAGDSPRVRGQDSRPRRRRTSPPATTCPRPRRMSPDARRTPARAVGPDHEWGTPTDRPLRRTSADRHASPSNHHGPASGTNKRHLRCGAAEVAAPVHARCSQSVGKSSPVRPTPQPQRVVIGHPQLVGYFCPIPHPDDEEADCE